MDVGVMSVVVIPCVIAPLNSNTSELERTHSAAVDACAHMS